ncbi:unnamed protein product [Trichobilharzia regenti]|nr:unnamed protein product [Trichobilharzia regenti]
MHFVLFGTHHQEDIPAFPSRSDPYVKIKHTGSVLARSRMVPNNSNPVWDEKFWFRLCSLELPIELKVYHRDAFKKDSYIGRTLVSLLDIEMDR